MVSARHSLAVIVCLIYVPHITSAFLRKSVLQKRAGKSTRARESRIELGNTLSFKEELQPETVATKYGSIVLECQAVGIPTPTIHWLKDGVRLTQDSFNSASDDDVSYEDPVRVGGKRLLSISSTRSKLYLDCLTEDDEAQYTCVAENALLRKSQSTLLRVVRPENILYSDVHECHGKSSNRGEPARIYMWTVSRLEFENSKVQLFCRAQGNPQPTIMWYDRFNKPIESDDNYQIAENGDLIIRDITWADMGVFTCVADNGLGSDTTETFLYPTSRGDGFPF